MASTGSRSASRLAVSAAVLLLPTCCLGQRIAEDSVEPLFPPSSEAEAEAAMVDGPAASLLRLNSLLFGGNVLDRSEQPHTAHWIVSFCLHWWEPCQELARPYALLSAEWQTKLNKDLLTSEVRFATVDCAKDKVLCNEQDVNNYPTIAHYTGGAQVAKFVGGRKFTTEKLEKWLLKELVDATATNATTTATQEETTQQIQESFLARLVPVDRAADVLLALVAVAASFRMVLTNPELGWQKEQQQPVVRPDADVAGAAERSAAKTPLDWAGSRASLEL